MDEDKHIERQTDLWIRCEQTVKRKLGEDAGFAEIKAIYKEVNKWLISDRIQKERKAGFGPAEDKGAEPASEKQISYIKDLHGTVTTGMTKAEASKLIEDLKK